MHLKIRWIVLGLIVVILAGGYFFPTPRQEFSQNAANVPVVQSQAYQVFREAYAPRRLQVNGVWWEYISVGSGGETFLFLHGMTGAYDIWWQQILGLQSNYKVIALTYPAVDDLEALSDGVIAILDREQVEKANLVGTSLGGYLAQYLIASHPERVSRAVLSNTFPPNDILRQDNAAIGALLPFLPEWVIKRTLLGSIEESVYPASGNDPFTRAYLLELVSSRVSKVQVVGRYRSVVEEFTPPNPMAQGILTMIIEVDNDPLVNETLREQLRQTYPNAVLVTLTGAGHFPYLNQAETYTKLLTDFLELPIMQ